MMSYKQLVACCVVALSLAGCATNGDPRDPLEPMNRAVHGFNETVDRVAMKPLAQGYKAALPGFAQTGVRNFFSNLDDAVVVANDLLQLKIERASQDLMRVAINSGLGLFGILDIASEAGLKKHNEDFGQTLGHWGVGTGPYLVLPFFGPSNFRDTAGLIVDSSYADPVYSLQDNEAGNSVVVVRAISRRADLLDAKTALDTAALDGYEYSRDFYLERRRALVYDGKPPKRLEEY